MGVKLKLYTEIMRWYALEIWFKLVIPHTTNTRET